MRRLGTGCVARSGWLREGCLAAERRYGLTVTAPADRTAATHTTRGEREKAARAGRGEAPRDWLRRQVRLAAVAAGSDTEFLDRPRGVGVTVKERRGQAGELTGSAVARPDPASGEVVFYGGAGWPGTYRWLLLGSETARSWRCWGRASRFGWVSEKSPHNGVSRRSYAAEFSYGPRVELGYARVSTAKQDLERQIEALTAVGIARERIFLDNKSGARVDRPGLRAVLGFARRGDVIVVHSLGSRGGRNTGLCV